MNFINNSRIIISTIMNKNTNGKSINEIETHNKATSDFILSISLLGKVPTLS